MADWQFETKQIHSGAQPDPTTNARATPIYKTTSYVFNSTEHAKNLFALADFGNIHLAIIQHRQNFALPGRQQCFGQFELLRGLHRVHSEAAFGHGVDRY